MVTVGVGDNWWLPPGTPRAGGTGRTWMSINAAVAGAASDGLVGDGRYAVTIYAVWKSIHLGPGVFDWSSIDTVVAQVEANSHAIGVYLFPRVNSLADHIPTWVLNYTYELSSSENYIRWWADGNGTAAPLLTFVAALLARYADNARCVYIDARSPIDDDGEWPGLDEEDRTDAAYEWIVAYHQQYATSAGIHVDKIVTTMNAISGAGAYRYDEILTACYAMGIGQRDGSPSRMRLETQYGLEMDLTTLPTEPKQTQIARWTMNEAFPLADGRISYSEATEFDYESENWGPVAQTHLRWRSALLWSLTVRRNWLAMGRSNVVIAEADMVNWIYRELGKTVDTAQDAFFNCQVAFNETDSNLQYFHGYGQRWLQQIDVADGGTPVLADDVGQPERWLWPTNYTSFRTDLGNGEDSIYFQVASEFVGDETEWQLKVRFLDSTNGSFYIDYETAGGTAQTVAVTGTSSGDEYTATFNLPGFAPAHGLAENADFRIVATDADIHVQFVRLIKLTEHRDTTHWRGYLALENATLSAGEFASLITLFKAFGPAGVETNPAFLNHSIASGSKIVLEAKFDNTNVMEFTIKNALATVLDVDAATIDDIAEEVAAGTQYTFEISSVNQITVTLLGGSTGSWSDSHTQALQYISEW